ncbi:MAG: SDR family NAD(P)-dependent oxidoreductase [Bacteroidia bacterium]|nr:SDR family NAD(P)-dependent oxidoreductase [Bacteroidia bacterium]NNC86134.1 SDR family NAD(P)-dependent oxidoreductase [Bacteroidia bacterium]NNM16844.1 SDR family NAD(P)-dependent oxidoreductase [Bacteroidia bacterium]
MPTAFITGATAGFGQEIAIIFAEHGYNVIINGRRKDRLENLKSQLEENYGIQALTLPFDVRIKDDVFNAINNLPNDWKNIDVLINNAGLALGLSSVQSGNTDDWDVMLDTNVKGLLYVSRAVAPIMVNQKNGHIINIGSIAGKQTYHRGNVYSATKYAVDALTKAMRIDMLPYQVKVSAVNPGAAETEFSEVRFKGDKDKAKSVYEGYTPLKARDVAEVVYFVATRPANVVINDVVITPLAQASSAYLYRKTEK